MLWRARAYALEKKVSSEGGGPPAERERKGGLATVGLIWTVEIKSISTVRWSKDGGDRIGDGEVRIAQVILAVQPRSYG